MNNVIHSAKLRARTVREKQGKDADTAPGPSSLPLPKIEKGGKNQEKKEKKDKKESKTKGKSKKK